MSAFYIDPDDRIQAVIDAADFTVMDRIAGLQKAHKSILARKRADNEEDAELAEQHKALTTQRDAILRQEEKFGIVKESTPALEGINKKLQKIEARRTEIEGKVYTRSYWPTVRATLAKLPEGFRLEAEDLPKPDTD